MKRPHFLKRALRTSYMLASMGLTVVFAILIWNLTFGHLVDAYREHEEKIRNIEELKIRKEHQPEPTFKEAILDSEERVKHYLGYRVLEEMRLEGHFHHIDLDIEPDQRCYCIQCHGDLPHAKVEQMRAFWNMHSSFMSCQTCHVRLDKPGSRKYGWYARTTGEIVTRPEDMDRPTPITAKIIPFELKDGQFQRVDTQARIAFVNDYLDMKPELSELQKTMATRIIHHIVDRKPYVCEDCHRKERPLLSFKELGYSDKRIAALESNEVVGMIKKYENLYFPQLLNPGVRKSK